LLAEIEALEDFHKAAQSVAAGQISLVRNQRASRLAWFAMAALIAAAAGYWGWSAVIAVLGGIYVLFKSRPIREAEEQVHRLGVSHVQAVTDLQFPLAEIDSADAETQGVLHQKPPSW
jgi:hypothetical protein